MVTSSLTLLALLLSSNFYIILCTLGISSMSMSMFLSTTQSHRKSSRKGGFQKRCFTMVKQQKTRFYILGRCISMLLCWHDHSLGDDWRLIKIGAVRCNYFRLFRRRIRSLSSSHGFSDTEVWDIGTAMADRSWSRERETPPWRTN